MCLFCRNIAGIIKIKPLWIGHSHFSKHRVLWNYAYSPFDINLIITFVWSIILVWPRFLNWFFQLWLFIKSDLRILADRKNPAFSALLIRSWLKWFSCESTMSPFKWAAVGPLKLQLQFLGLVVFPIRNINKYLKEMIIIFSKF